MMDWQLGQVISVCCLNSIRLKSDLLKVEYDLYFDPHIQ